MLCQGTS